MLNHYFKISLRNLWKNKGHTLINVLGLTLGIFCATFLFVIIQVELSYNDQIEDSDQIYRIVSTSTQYGRISRTPGIAYVASEALRTDFPQVQEIVMADENFTGGVIHVKDQNGQEVNRFKGDDMLFIEPNYFEVISYDWISGDKETAMQEPNSAVITDALAEKYFGNSDVLGRTLILFEDTVTNYTITGIVRKLPKTTDFPFQLFLSFDMRRPKKFGMDTFNSTSSGTQVYIKLDEQTQAEEIEALFPEFIEKHYGEKDAEYLSFALQPLSDLHYNEEYESYGGNFPYYAIMAIALIGVFLLITACINFINLNTALVFKRGKEIGLRKVLGSHKIQIVNYFLVETGMITLFSWVLAWGLAALLFEPLANWLEIGEWIISWSDPTLWGFGLLIFSLILIFAGLSPAILLSRLSPVLALKNKVDNRYGKGLNMRKILIVTQFAISQVMIICTLTAMKQISFFRQQPTGLTSEAVVEVFLPDADTSYVFEVWKDKVNLIPGVSSLTYSNTGSTSNSTWSSNFTYYPQDTTQNPLVEEQAHMKTIDEQFITTYGIEMLAGENIRESDSITHVMVNETFLTKVGVENPTEVLGMTVKVWGSKVPIVGVTKDYTTRSLKNEIPPVIMVNNPSERRAGILLETSEVTSIMDKIEDVFLDVFPDQIFEYKFLDETIEEFYETERIAFKVFVFASVIAIFIGCLGLFGLVSFMAERRTKEIGVRKVLGASIQEIMKMFSWEFAVLVIVGFIVAVPVASFFMNSWLEEFAYRISLPIEFFFLTFIFAIIFMGVTVGWRAWNVARTNPIKALRDE